MAQKPGSLKTIYKKNLFLGIIVKFNDIQVSNINKRSYSSFV